MSNPQLTSRSVLGRLAPDSTAPKLMVAKRRLPISVRFTLRAPKKGQPYSNPHPLEVWITVNGYRVHFTAFWKESRLDVDPADWDVRNQTTLHKADPVNRQITAVKAYVESVFQDQLDTGGKPTVKSIHQQLTTGEAPEWYGEIGWVFPSDKRKRALLGQYGHCICGQTPIDEVYAAYILHLEEKQGRGKSLSRVARGRWERGLLLIREFAKQTEQSIPRADKITLGWAKRHHTWLQNMPLTAFQRKPTSAPQASRYIHQLSHVLQWMIEEDWIQENPIKKVSWPRYDDKPVESLEPEQVYHLLQLDWKGTKGISLWWFMLMCCTGMDYPDAVAYAQNRQAFEVMGSGGKKIVGRRKKPPHSEYHLPLLPEVELLFNRFPKGAKILCDGVINRYTDQIEDELGINWRITAKTARKTFGFLMKEAGHLISDVSLMMGHSTIITTERHYVKVKGTSIDRAMKRIHVNLSELAGAEGRGDE
ncbi:hypothetical protein GCM10028805_25870 [Spirosoma harenae]